jgi:glycosyltransferase involved in cell wall biosynthesis
VVVWRLAADLAAREIRVSVVTLHESAERLTSIKDQTGVVVAVGPYRPRHRMRDLMRVERLAVRDGVRLAAPDIVHAHWCGEYALGALAAGVPTLVTAHDWLPGVLRHTAPQYLPYWLARTALYFLTLAKAQHVSAVSPYSASRVRLFTRAAVEVIPNGVEDDLFVDCTAERDAGRPTGEDDRVFVSVNNGFSPRKNVHRLLEAFAIVRRRIPTACLTLVGTDYEEGGPCETSARANGLERGVVFRGSLDRDAVIEAIDGALSLVHPAREENMPLTLIEAMARGVAVIGGRHSGGVPWVLDHGRAGLLVDVKDPAAIAQGMLAVARNDDLRRSIARAGNLHARANFCQSRVTDMYLDAYRRVLAEVE